MKIWIQTAGIQYISAHEPACKKNFHQLVLQKGLCNFTDPEWTFPVKITPSLLRRIEKINPLKSFTKTIS